MSHNGTSRITSLMSQHAAIDPASVERSFELCLATSDETNGTPSTEDEIRAAAQNYVRRTAVTAARKALSKAFAEIYAPYAEAKAMAHVLRANARHPELAPAAPLQ